MGVMYTWPSSTLNLFSSANTTLDRVMTENEISLLGSISSISAIIITPFCGYLLDTLGRKRSCILFYMAQVACWVIIVMCNKVEAVLFAMFLSGLTGCMMLIVPVYVSEFCQESIRGSMTSGSMIFYGIGMLVSYLLGGLLEYKMMNYVSLTLTIIGLTLLCFMKDSPMFLVKSGQLKKAAQSIAFYRGLKIDSKELRREMENIKNLLNEEPNCNEIPQEEKGLHSDENPKQKISQWKYLKKSRSTQRALVVCIVLYTASIFQGLIVVQVFAVPLFKEAVPTISTTLSSVIFAIVSVISGFFGAYFIDWFGRRPLMIYGSIATGLSCLVLGLQIQLNWGPTWLTAVLINLYCVAYTFGAGTVPYVIVAEVFMPEIKSLASMVSTEWLFFCGFVILYIFNPLVSALGLGPVFYIFAAFCFFSAIFSHFFLPETKGLPVNLTAVDNDMETTGITEHEIQKTKITELSLIAVERKHLVATRNGLMPRVQNKITLCLNPQKLILPGPVCLIAHNGLYYDFPILKSHLEKIGAKFSVDLLCSDSLYAFYEIMENTKIKWNNEIIETIDLVDDDEDDIQSLNEKTPKKYQIIENKTPNKLNPNTPSRMLQGRMWFNNKPKESYKLKNIYKRLLDRSPREAHRAENDCLMMLECSVALSKDFVQWVDKNNCRFSDIEPMSKELRSKYQSCF
ncbi:unnamed protein product, partial [Brenthis ino]